jgi:hypothetical protein
MEAELEQILHHGLGLDYLGEIFLLQTPAFAAVKFKGGVGVLEQASVPDLVQILGDLEQDLVFLGYAEFQGFQLVLLSWGQGRGSVRAGAGVVVVRVHGQFLRLESSFILYTVFDHWHLWFGAVFNHPRPHVFQQLRIFDIDIFGRVWTSAGSGVIPLIAIISSS